MANSPAESSNPKDQPTLPFEEALQELEQVVYRLEHEQLSLDESLALFQRGQFLGDYCGQLLDEAELKVTTLTPESLAEGG